MEKAVTFGGIRPKFPPLGRLLHRIAVLFALLVLLFLFGYIRANIDYQHLIPLNAATASIIDKPEPASDQSGSYQLVRLANGSSVAVSSFVRAARNPILCTAIIAQRGNRSEEHLNTAVGSLLDALSDAERRSVHVDVLFAKDGSDAQMGREIYWVEKLVDYVGSYKNLTEQQEDELRRAQELGNHDFRGLLEYIHSADHCVATGAQYIAIFQDNVRFEPGWMRPMLEALSNDTTTENNLSAWMETGERWLYLDLAAAGPPKQPVVQEPVDPWIIYFGVTAAAYAASFLLCRCCPHVRQHIERMTSTLFALTLLVAFLQLLLSAGIKERNDVTHSEVGLLTGSRLHVHSVVYPRYLLEDVLKYIKGKHEGHVDNLVSEYVEEEGYVRHQLIPGIVQTVKGRLAR